MAWSGYLLVSLAHPAAATLPPPSLRVSFSEPVNVSQTETISQAADVTHDAAGAIHACWEEYGNLIMCARSDDAGATFTEPDRVVPGGPYLSFGQARVVGGDPGELHVAFTSFDTFYGGAEIVHAGSTDAGDTFAQVSVVSDIDEFNSYAPDIALGWGVVIAWNDTDLFTGRGRIRVSTSIDGGVTFSAPKRVDASEGDVNGVGVAAAGDGVIFTAWVQNDDPFGTLEESEIFFSRSTDAGASFSDPINISNDDEKSWPPLLAADGEDTIHVLWPSGPAFDQQRLMLATSRDGGASFSEPQAVAFAAQMVFGDIAVPEPGTVWLSWMSLESTDMGFAFSSRVTRSIDAGRTFAAEAVSPGGHRITCPTPTEVFAVWNEVAEGQFVDEVFVSRGKLDLCGDADDDGRLYATDALVTLKTATASAECALCRCDVDRSGQVTATDALAVLRSVVGLVAELDCAAC